MASTFKAFLYEPFSEPPFFTEKPEAVSLVRVGDRKVFECRYGGTPEISVKWFREGVQLQQSVKHKMSVLASLAILEVCQVSQRDGGKYFCEVSNEAGTESCSFELVVKGWFCAHISQKGDHVAFCTVVIFNFKGFFRALRLVLSEPPSFVEEFSSLQVVKGSTAVFTSKVAGSAPFDVMWFKDQRPVSFSQRFLIVDGENVGLKIQHCDVDDVGTYECVVANEVGRCSGLVVLSLKGWFCWLFHTESKLPCSISYAGITTTSSSY